MNPSAQSATTPQYELQRLRSLLPESLQGKVLVEAVTRSLPELIRCGENPRGGMVIECDGSRWMSLAQDQRDLLFWHQVARIQSGTAPQEGWERAALFLGLGGMVGEIWVQDGLLFGLCLGLATVSGVLLYRRRQRQGWPAIIGADREAIQLAIQSGYSRSSAHKSLTRALQSLKDQAPAQQQALYKARLDALGQP